MMGQWDQLRIKKNIDSDSKPSCNTRVSGRPYLLPVSIKSRTR